MKIIDLSLPIDNETQLPPSIQKKVDIATVKKPDYWQASWLSIGAHIATHVDSPLHVCEGAPTIGEIPLEKVIGEAIVLDLNSKCFEDAIIGPEDLMPFESDIKEGDIVILDTGWTNERWNAPDFSYWLKSPTVSVEGAKWLVEKKPKAVAFDCFQDIGARKADFAPADFEMHRVILGAGIIIIEGLVNLNLLTSKRVKFFAAPLKIMNAEAAPCRAFAIE